MFKSNTFKKSSGVIVASMGCSNETNEDWVVEATDYLPELLQDAKGAAQTVASLLGLHFPKSDFNLDTWLQDKGFRWQSNQFLYAKTINTAEWRTYTQGNRWILKNITMADRWEFPIPTELYIAEAVFDMFKINEKK